MGVAQSAVGIAAGCLAFDLGLQGNHRGYSNAAQTI
jgi:hypothetical protein